MKAICRLVATDNNGNLCLRTVDREQFKLGNKVIIGIDGSSTCTGITFLDSETGYFVGSMALERSSGESAVRYKVNFRHYMDELLGDIKTDNIFYEEPFIGYAEASKVLFMIRSTVEEVIIENEPKYDHIIYTEVNNKRWKSRFVDEKLLGNTELEKKAIREKVLSILPFLKDITQDEMDAFGLATVGREAAMTHSENELKSHKKAKPFKYNIEFIGADDDEEFVEQYYDCIESFKVPAVLRDKNAEMFSIGSRGIFENYVYSCMGDEDKLIIIKFKSTSHANVIIEHRLSNLADSNEYLYAVVWRKSRKK
jgi:Holliday junction resolvasome RuvABC endonuclease subunit